MSHSRSLDFNEVMCTEYKEKERKMNRERETGSAQEVHQIYDIILTT